MRKLLGTVDDFLLTNVYSNSSLRTILTLTNSEKLKALSRLFCLDIYEKLEKEAKKELVEIKKKQSFLQGKKEGLKHGKDIEHILIELRQKYKEDEKYLEVLKEKIQEKIRLEKKKEEYYQKIKNIEERDFEKN